MKQRILERVIPRRARRFLRHAANLVPLTWRGALVALSSALALWHFGFGSLDMLLFVTGVSGLVLVALSSITVAGAALYLRRRLGGCGLGTRRLEAGSPIRTDFEVPALGRIPLVKVRWEWLEQKIRHVVDHPHGEPLADQ